MKESKQLINQGKWRSHPLYYGLLAYCGFLFVTVLIRSIISGMTYDEAYTYINFGIIDLFRIDTLRGLYGKANCIANNHWLNSILINILHRIVGADYNEFIVRLPSLSFFVLYIVGMAYGYKKKFYSLTAFVFFICNYYLLEFYGLARGYGMANTCVFFACLSYCKWKESGYQVFKHLNWLMICLSIGTFANTIVLLLYPAFGFICLLRIIQYKQFKPFLKRNGLIFILFILFSLLMVKYHMNISSVGKPLYTGGGQGFFDSVVIGYVNMFVENRTAALIVGIAIIVSIFASIVILRKDAIKQDFTIMLVIFVATNILLQLALHKGYIATRVLLPFYSFLVFCFYELYSATWTKLEGKREKDDRRKGIGLLRRACSAIVCVALMVGCVLQIDLHSTKDWKESYKFKTVVVGELLTGEAYDRGDSWDATDVYYQKKVEKLKNDYLEQLNAEK